jgi:pimeloyl-ACP methyl ester carboxylesterase
MPFAQFRGQPLYYAEHLSGAPGGTPLVLVHGAGGTHLHWPPQVRRLPGVSVCALDLPGRGRSGGCASSSIADKAEAVLALLDHMGAARAVVGGHSMGGAIAQTLALSQPARVVGLVLVGTGGRLRVSQAILEGVARDFPATVGLIVESMFGPQASPDLKRLAHKRMLEVDPEVLLGDWRACNAFDVLPRLPEIAAPALVVAGTADTLTPEKYARYLAEHLPRARLCLVPGAGHMVMLEQPAAVAAAVADFVREVGQRRV